MPPTGPYLAMHILNRVWTRLLKIDRFEEMHVIEKLQDGLIEEHQLEPNLVELLEDIRHWCSHHEVPEVK